MIKTVIILVLLTIATFATTDAATDAAATIGAVATIDADVQKDSNDQTVRVITTYQHGTYFLGNVKSYTSTYAYFFGINGGEREMYEITWNECDQTSILIPRLQSIYEQCGAHDFRFNTFYGGTNKPGLPIPPDYSASKVVEIPLSATLMLYVNPLSAVNVYGDGNGTYIMNCMLTNSSYNCLSTYDQDMINCIIANTDIVLETQSCLPSWKLAVICTTTIIGGLALLCGLCCCCSRYFEKQNRRKDGYEKV